MAGWPTDSASQAFRSPPFYPVSTSLGLEPFSPALAPFSVKRTDVADLFGVFYLSSPFYALISFQSKPWDGHSCVLGHSKLFLALFTLILL